MNIRPHNGTVRLIGAGIAVGALALAGCSSNSASSPSSSASPTESPTAAASASQLGGNVLPPIMVDHEQNVNAKVGDTIVVTSAGVTKVATNHADMLEVSQPHNDGSASFHGGAKVLKAGQGDLSVYGANDKFLYLVTVSAQ